MFGWGSGSSSKGVVRSAQPSAGENSAHSSSTAHACVAARVHTARVCARHLINTPTILLHRRSRCST